MGHISEALAAYNRTLALDPHNPDVWLNVARALKGAGRMDEAEAALLRSLRLDEQGRPKDGQRWGGGGEEQSCAAAARPSRLHLGRGLRGLQSDWCSPPDTT
jgi:tetratricopeptide (TPR) repeat protein